MSVHHSTSEGLVKTSNSSFSKAQAGLAVGLVIGVALVTIGILGLIKVLPGLSYQPAALLTGCGGACLMMTTILFNYQIGGKQRSNDQSSLDITPSAGKEEETDESPLLPHTPTPMPVWREKLEELRRKNASVSSEEDVIGVERASVTAEECLNTLCFLTQDTVRHLFKSKVPHSGSSNAVLQELLREGISKRGHDLYQLIAHSFFAHLPTLTNFLKQELKVILNETASERTRETYKTVNKQIRCLLLFFMSHAPPDEKGERRFVAHYEYLLNKSTKERFCPSAMVRGFPLTGDFQERGQLLKFLFLFLTYRRHALIRLFPQRIEKRTRCDIQGSPLLSATWFHGTRSLTTLDETDFTLMPSGWLSQVGCIPFFGEMKEGAQLHEVNSNALSGTQLDYVNWSMSDYAKGFQFDIKNEIAQVTSFLAIKRPGNLSSFCFNSETLSRMEVAMKRWAKWDPAEFKEKIPLIQDQLKILKGISREIEENNVIKKDDKYYSTRFNSLLHSLSQIERLITNPLPSPLTPEQKKKIQNNFPAVLGSYTLLGEPLKYCDNREYLMHGAVQLGKDLQFLCVSTIHFLKAKSWVKTHLPDANIRVFTFFALEAAQRVDQKMSPYLFDYFSLKKLKKLSGTASTSRQIGP